MENRSLKNMSWFIYHNPRCSKSREALAILQDNVENIKIIEYLKNPPSKIELNHILSSLGLSIREIIRQKEKEYREIKTDATDEEMIAFVLKHPILLERPIVIGGGRGIIARPPEKIIEFLRSFE